MHQHPILLRPADLAARLGLCRRSIYYLATHPDPARRLPAPVKVGRATCWRADEIELWLAGRERVHLRPRRSAA